jgi:NAD(P)-dependent dehydrogenase (short-subunit alcohol dehydrogenase family)
MGILAGKVAVITGGTRGLGRAIAQAFASEGAAVVVASRSAEAVEQTVRDLTAAGAQASGIPCDVSDLAQVRALAAHALEAFGRFDVWVNNAGVAGPQGPTIHVPLESFERVLQTNIFGVYYGSVVAMEYFLPRGSGKLINILGRGAREPGPFQNAYASTKAWIRNFTLAVAKEYKDSGVGVYAFNPGMMRTDLLMRVTAVEGYEARLKLLETVIRMWATPPEAPARKVVWLASAATDGRTGLEVKLSGPASLLGGMAKEGMRRLLRRPAPPLDVTVRTVPPALSTEISKRTDQGMTM